MTSLEFQRRSSYGPSSPAIGSRGARTRMQIVEAALTCFTTNGYYSTSVDDIATLASTSRATLYQYFESKDAIFVTLMIESGAALANELRHIGPLGPDADGYAGLRSWLDGSVRTYDLYAPMFIEWANVNMPRAALKGEVTAYVDLHVERFSRALADRAGADVEAVVVLGTFTRFNYIRHVYRPGLTDAQLFDSLACALQRYLFPSTPDRVLAGATRADETSGPARPLITRTDPLRALPPHGSIDRPDPFDGLSEQAATTIRQLLDAASRVFAANGYHAANIDQIVTEAGLARGTFYRYFNTKGQLLTALSLEASAAMCPLFVEFATFADRRHPALLRNWLRRFLAVQRTHSGVVRCWTEGAPIDPALLVGAAEVVEAMSSAIEATFGPVRGYPLDRRAGGMLLSSLLENVPRALGARHEPTDDQLIEAQALFIERVVFPD